MDSFRRRPLVRGPQDLCRRRSLLINAAYSFLPGSFHSEPSSSRNNSAQRRSKLFQPFPCKRRQPCEHCLSCKKNQVKLPRNHTHGCPCAYMESV